MTKLTKLQKELLCILSEDGLSVSEECYKKVEELVEVMKEEKYNEVVLGITIYDDYER